MDPHASRLVGAITATYVRVGVKGWGKDSVVQSDGLY